jgi:hypothetical protein
MEIHGPGNVSGPERPEPHRINPPGADRPVDFGPVTDRVEISEHARLLEKLSELPAVRADRVAEVVRLIESGAYETPERIAGAVEKLLDEIWPELRAGR